MFVEVFKAAYKFRRNGEQVPFEELVNSPSLLLEVATDYNWRKSIGPSHTWKEVQAELIMINGHWTDIKERGEDMSWWIKHTTLWINDCHKEEYIFMPSTKAKKGASSKSKGPAASKFDDDDDDDFMPRNWANKASSTKGKRVAKP
jgi:hypothetical protein